MTAGALHGARRFAFYITGHGFGHATRAIAVMQALHAAAPDVHFLILTAAPESLFQQSLPPHVYTYRMVRIDTGAFEQNILDTDIQQSVSKADAFYDKFHEIAGREARFLMDQRVDLLLFDVPPLAAEIAYRADIPSVAIGNFTWDFIYRAWKPNWFLLKQMAEWQAHTTLALQLPAGHELESFPRRRSIPLVARKSELFREDVRRELNITPTTFCLLLALRGGKGHLPQLPYDSDVLVISFGEIHDSPGVLCLGDAWKNRFLDVLAAADVVLSKPGYGIISECYAARRPLLHLPRGNFAETPLLLEWMKEWLPSEQIALDEVKSGALIQRARNLVARPFTWKDQPINGAAVAAQHILEVIHKK